MVWRDLRYRPKPSFNRDPHFQRVMRAPSSVAHARIYEASIGTLIFRG